MRLRGPLALLVALGVGCGDDGSGGSGGGPPGEAELRGGVEKGPLVLGSTVTVSILGEDLAPTGDTFVTQTLDDAGTFEITVPAGPVALEATGFAFDELAGELSGAPMTLRAVAVSSEPAVFVNVKIGRAHV